MKANKNQIFKTIVSIILTAFIVAVYVFLCVTAFKFYTINKVLLVALLVLGAVLSLFLHSLLHELGHLIFGLIAGLKLYKICVLVFELEVYDGKVKFNFKKPSINFGYTVMMPKKHENYGEKLVFSSFGGLIFSFVFTLLNAFLTIKLATNVYFFTLIGAYYLIGFYIFIVNVLPFTYDNDGALIFDFIFSKEYYVDFKNAYTILAKIYCGVMPSEIDLQLFTCSGENRYSQIIKYHKYLALLSTDFDGAEKELNSLSSSNIIDDDIYFAVKKELLFSACVKGDSKYAKTNGEHVIDLLGQDDYEENYRVHAVYRIFTGETDWAKIIIDGGINALNTGVKNGYEKSEIKYLQELKNQIQ